MRRAIVIWRDDRGEEVAREVVTLGHIALAKSILTQMQRNPVLRPSIVED